MFNNLTNNIIEQNLRPGFDDWRQPDQGAARPESQIVRRHSQQIARGFLARNRFVNMNARLRVFNPLSLASRRMLIQRNAFPPVNYYHSILTAARFGDAFAVQSYLSRASDEELAIHFVPAFRNAVERGFAHVVKVFLNNPRFNPAVLENRPIRDAAFLGHEEIVRLLLQDSRVDPSVCANEAIRMAVVNQHIGVVAQLLNDSRVDPIVASQYAIRSAVRQENFELLGLILSDDRTRTPEVILMLQDNMHHEALRHYLENRHQQALDRLIVLMQTGDALNHDVLHQIILSTTISKQLYPFMLVQARNQRIYRVLQAHNTSSLA